MDYNRLTKAYLNIRAARSALRKKFDQEDGALKENLKTIEAQMLKHLNDSGLESARTDVGTFYRQESLKPAASDWQAFYGWIKEEDAFDALERRIKATFIKEYMEDNDGALPPGVSVHREYDVRVRKSS